MTLIFYEELHEYVLDGVSVPSVSELMEPLRSREYQDIPYDVLGKESTKTKPSSSPKSGSDIWKHIAVF